MTSWRKNTTLNPQTIELPGKPVPAAPLASHLTPLSLDEVTLDAAGFWGARQRLNADAIIGHCEYWMEKVGWIPNFDAAAEGRLPRDRQGREFSDADVYKLVEAMSWEFGRTGDPALDDSIRSIVARIGAAQEPDGYLNTNFGRPGQVARYSDLEWGHELYDYGHLLQAAVARSRTYGRDALFDIATRVADHVCAEFGPTGRNAVCGHPEIEVGLAEFARLTDNDLYRKQAALFVERRGNGLLADIEWGRSYFQDDVPVRASTILHGHAVRALYLAAAAVDIAVDTRDDELLDSIRRQWDATVARRTYLTGGMGSHHQDEAFGQDFELPNDRAYCETCAGVALIMLSWRLQLATGEPRYGDMIERVLYNVVATSPSEDGRAFFYSNTLHQRTPGDVPPEDKQVPRAASSLRAPWFAVSCCPPNVARLLASLGAYVATSTAEGIQLHQFAAGTIRATLPTGDIEVTVATRYPRDGQITVYVLASVATEWTLTLRVPSWATGATLEHNGIVRQVEPGIASVTAVFAVGDTVVLNLPVSPRFTFPDLRIDATRGTVAVERGPQVYCLESVDLTSGADIESVVVDVSVPPRDTGDIVTVRSIIEPSIDAPWPYANSKPARALGAAVSTTLVPYHSWANRGPSAMRVWVRSNG